MVLFYNKIPPATCQNMQETTQSDLQFKIHQVLSNWGFYHLPLIRLASIMRLLGAEETREAKAIQSSTISGLIQFTDRQQQKLQNYFTENKFAAQARDVQEYLSAIIRDVIDERYQGNNRSEGASTAQDQQAMQYNRLNLMGFGTSPVFPTAPRLFGTPEMPPPPLPFPNGYLSYNNFNNPEMYYYRMYGGFPPQQINPPTATPIQQKIAEPIMHHKQVEKLPVERMLPRQSWKKEQEGMVLRNKAHREQNQEEENTKKRSKRLMLKQARIAEQKERRKKEKLERRMKKLESKDLESKIQSLLLVDKKKQLLDKILPPRKITHHKVYQNLPKDLSSKNEQYEQFEQKHEKNQQEKQSRQKQIEKHQQSQQISNNVQQPIQLPKKKKPNKIIPIETIQEDDKMIPEPMLELKYYNSVSDFDYRVFPNVNKVPPVPSPPPKKVSVTVQTQTDINLILNDFRIVKKKQVDSDKMEEEPPKQQEKAVREHDHKQKGENHDEIDEIEIEEVNSSSIRAEKSLANNLLEIVSSEIKAEEQEHFGINLDNSNNHPIPNERPISEKDDDIQPHPNSYELPQNIQQSPPNIDQPQPPPEQAPLPPPIPPAPNCACGGAAQLAITSCTICEQRYHLQCLRMGAVDTFICPRCRIRSLDPFLDIRRICGEFFVQDLLRGQFRARVNVMDLEYLLKKNHDRMEEIELRCIWVDNTEELTEIIWPDEAEVRVNGSKLTQFYRPSALRKRRDTPLIITQAAFKISAYDIEDYGVAEITIALKPLPAANSRSVIVPTAVRLPPNNGGLFLVGIYHTCKLTISTLFERISSNLPTSDFSFVTGLLLGEELSLEMEVLRMQDPFSGQIIQLPVRGTACRHAQCFDLRTFLALMSALKYRAWRCPICGRQAKKFIVDAWFQDLTQRAISSNTVPSRILVTQDGKVTLRMGEPQAQEPPSEDQEVKKSKQIKKKHRGVKREYLDDPFRIYDHNYQAEIDKYFGDEVKEKDNSRKGKSKK